MTPPLRRQRAASALPFSGSLPALLLTIALCGAVASLVAQAEPPGRTDPAPGPLFRIGYLRPEGESDLTDARMERLRQSLLSDTDLVAALRAEGYGSEVGLFTADGGADMLRRLTSREFDLAFVPSRTWAEQEAGYTVILQSRRKRDFVYARGRRVQQQGVLFVSPRSPLFAQKQLGDEAVRRYLDQETVAVVSTQSMAGFVAPLLELSRTYGISQPGGGFLWCESSAEVAKAVLSGLVDVGICEFGALEETLAEAGLGEEKEKLRRILLWSSPVPTDPVVVRPEIAPQTSALGRELKRALRSFSLQEGFGEVELQSAQDSDFTQVRGLLREFDDRVGEVRI